MSDETIEDLLEDEDMVEELADELLDEAGEGDLVGEEIAAEAGEDEAEFFEDDEDEAAEDDDEDEKPAVPLDASEDGDDELDTEPAVDLAAIEGLDVDDPAELDEELDADDTIRDGEFVCASCHMAKRASALADADEMLCRDCV